MPRLIHPEAWLKIKTGLVAEAINYGSLDKGTWGV
jgi:hypothetical protein